MAQGRRVRVNIIIVALVVLLAVLGGAFYYALRMDPAYVPDKALYYALRTDPAYVPDEALPAGWYLDSTEQLSARFGLHQQSRYTYVKNAEFPAALSVFTFYNILPQSNDDSVISTMESLMYSLAEEQNITITNNSSGVRRNSFYIELEGERNSSALEKEYLNIYGEFWKDGYGTYIMCIGFAKVGESSLLSSRMDTEGYEEIKSILIPAVTQ